jgi:hypothetical protein
MLQAVRLSHREGRNDKKNKKQYTGQGPHVHQSFWRVVGAKIRQAAGFVAPAFWLESPIHRVLQKLETD